MGSFKSVTWLGLVPFEFESGLTHAAGWLTRQIPQLRRTTDYKYYQVYK